VSMAIKSTVTAWKRDGIWKRQGRTVAKITDEPKDDRHAPSCHLHSPFVPDGKLHSDDCFSLLPVVQEDKQQLCYRSHGNHGNRANFLKFRGEWW
jgi:hypothetical protein